MIYPDRVGLANLDGLRERAQAASGDFRFRAVFPDLEDIQHFRQQRADVQADPMPDQHAYFSGFVRQTQAQSVRRLQQER